MKKSPFLVFAISIVLGLMIGIGFYTFIYARGYSYILNDPAVCVNCHIMKEEYNGWVKSPHGKVAVCNDCHTPHNFIGKYYTKARNGFWHSFYFTFGNFPDYIKITPFNRNIAEENCRRCHGDIVSEIDGVHPESGKISCLRCHQNVGH